MFECMRIIRVAACKMTRMCCSKLVAKTCRYTPISRYLNRRYIVVDIVRFLFRSQSGCPAWHQYMESSCGRVPTVTVLRTFGSRRIRGNCLQSMSMCLDSFCHATVRIGNNGTRASLQLTPSTPDVPNCCCSEGSAPYWSNPPFLSFDIRALWHSGLSAIAPECQKLKNGGLDRYGKV